MNKFFITEDHFKKKRLRIFLPVLVLTVLPIFNLARTKEAFN